MERVLSFEEDEEDEEERDTVSPGHRHSTDVLEQKEPPSSPLLAREDDEFADSHQSKFSRGQRAAVLILCGGSVFVFTLAFTCFLPTQPVVKSAFNLSLLLTVLIYQIFLITSGLLPVFLSGLVESASRRTVYLVLLPIFVFSQAASGFIPEREGFGWILFAGLAVSGAAVAPFISTGTACVIDTFPVSERGFGLAMLMLPSAVGGLIGPILGGYLTHQLGWRWTLWVPAALGALQTMLVLLFLPETKPAAGSPSSPPRLNPFPTLLKLLRKYPALSFLSLARGMALALSSMMVPLGQEYLSIVFFFNSVDLGYTFLPTAIGGILVGIIGGPLADVFGRRVGHSSGRLALAILMDCVTIVTADCWGPLLHYSPWGAVGITGFIGFGTRMARVGYFSTAVSYDPSKAATITSLLQFGIFCLIAVFSIIGPLLYSVQHSPVLPVAVSAICCCLALFPVLKIFLKLHARDSDPLLLIQ